MKYNVNLYHAVRIRMRGIEADTPQDAFIKAQETCDVGESLRRGAFEDDEAAALGGLVDPLDDSGEVVYDGSQYIEGAGAQLYLASSDAADTMGPAGDVGRHNPEAHSNAENVDGERRWRLLCSEQGWHVETQAVLFENFVREKGLFADFVESARSACAEEINAK